MGGSPTVGESIKWRRHGGLNYCGVFLHFSFRVSARFGAWRLWVFFSPPRLGGVVCKVDAA